MKFLASIFLVVITLVAFNSCNKKEDPAPEVIPTCFLTKISYDHGELIDADSIIFKYDGLVMIRHSDDSLLYNNNGNLTSYVIPDRSHPSDLHEFTYSGEEIVKQEWFWEFDGSLEGRETYEYTNHRLTRLQEWFLDPNDHTWKEGNYKTFEYTNDSSYNVSKMTLTNPFSGPSGVSTIEEYEYGDQKSQYSTMPLAVKKWYRLLELPTDNILTAIKHANGDVTTFLYTFNEQLLPSIRREYYNGDGIEAQRYTYKCN